MDIFPQNMAIPFYLKLTQLIQEILRFCYGIKTVLAQRVPLETVWFAPHAYLIVALWVLFKCLLFTNTTT